AWLSDLEPLALIGIVISLIFAPLLLTALTLALRTSHPQNIVNIFRDVLTSLAREVGQLALSLVFLPYDAFISLSGIGKSLVRMFVSGRGLLEWNAASNPRSSSGQGLLYFYREMAISPLIGLIFCGLILFNPSLQHVHNAQLFATLFLVFWSFAPALAWWISRPITEEVDSLSIEQTTYLRHLARKTWRFFETFVNSNDNWLPPDNFQEFPIATVAHRTSPTNIGLSLIANMTAFDFGYLSAKDVVDRVSKTLISMDKMEKFRGHFFNWYDTLTLEPLSPRYISTVDSGNLAGFLLTLKPGLHDLADSRIISDQAFQGLGDCLGIILTLLPTSSDFTRLAQCLKGTPKTISGIKQLLAEIAPEVSLLKEMCRSSDNAELLWWFEAFQSQLTGTISEPLKTYLAWSELAPTDKDEFWNEQKVTPAGTQEAAYLTELRNSLFVLDRLPTFRELGAFANTLIPSIESLTTAEASFPERLLEFHKAVTSASLSATALIDAIEMAIERCNEHSVFEFEFLYDRSRHLLSIGYNATQHRRDSGFYDLLASEARLCSFIGIAMGRLPQEHWFSLGRLVTATKGNPTLLSWSGSMFEYLMPLLIMPTFPNTLLDASYRAAVAKQIQYGKRRGVPWGVSESGYNATDTNSNYQYRAFGVPGLGFKRGLAEDLVIAPYASVMALMVAPDAACLNLRRMSDLGYEGRYGFYEAIDFTPTRLLAGEKATVIKSFMAHHQGMSLLSIGYLLLDQQMQKRFHSDPNLQGTELLLHERIPKVADYQNQGSEAQSIPRSLEEMVSPLRVISTPHTSRPEVHLLSNGRYSVMITNAGGGYSRWLGLAMTRWREDPTCDSWGAFCYFRDVQSGDFWSSGHQPTLKAADHYEAIFTQARAEFRRHDGDFETHTEITVSPEDDIELRRFSITNRSPRRRIIEVTSYSEVVLTSQSADEAHVAFSNLFVQTEILASKQAIICNRRPRSEHERTPTLVHLMSVHGDCQGDMSFETDRAKFVGRGGTKCQPAAMRSRSLSTPSATFADHLSGTAGSVLDPIVAIRCRIVIEPEQTARVHLVTGVGKDRPEALELIEKYLDKHLAGRVFDLAWTHRQIVLRQLSITEYEAQLYGKLASSIVYANPARRASASTLVKNTRGQSGLWGYGISGDSPIVLLKASSGDRVGTVLQLLRAHNYCRLMGLSFELVILIGDDASYRQDYQDEVVRLISTVSDAGLVDKSGGIFVRRAEQMSVEDRILLDTVARAVFIDKSGALADQIDRKIRPAIPVPQHVPNRKIHLGTPPSQGSVDRIPDGNFPNTFGDFSADGSEFIIQQTQHSVTPAPWSNVIANPFFGTVVSDSGAAYTWCENAHSFRLTPWQNDPIEDACGEGFYLRDEETGSVWSPSPLPVRGSSRYETRHGFGYSIFQHKTDDIFSELTTFVAIDAPVKICILKVCNDSDSNRAISITSYCEWVLGELRARSMMHIVTAVDLPTGAVFARNSYHHEFGERIGFMQVSEKSRTVSGDRTEFLGRNGRMASPAAMRAANLSGRVGAALDACGAMQVSINLSPGEEHEIVFLLGVGRDVTDARVLLGRFSDIHSAHLALESVHAYWRKTLSAVQIKTPDLGLNNLGNGWLVYQVMASRLWARSGYYQSSGAFGFRDQLQDTMALIHTEPRLLREHILRSAARQFKDGDVQHWWHPPSGRGVRTHFSDDYLWLPLATARYVIGLGDTGILDVPVNFIEGRPLKRDEEAYSDLPRRSEETATLYDHCVRAIRYGLKFGKNGLPLIGCGDWNDGMNLVGAQGRGESVWLGFFMYDVLSKFSAIAQLHGDPDFSALCLEEAKKIQENIETSSWDGERYRRAYFDDGTPLGSAKNSECKIDSLPQSWAVLSGAGNAERSRIAMESVNSHLVDSKNKIIKLFAPPFDKGGTDPGYIKGYVPGVRENGGQYTHAA
ncbi:MAG: cyclic beta 1-2 glucan synthetase, partial [Proteobacteria bacterium]|nr:cyclic beta 1-2 glucan synthetase [Pseudomonadota bacterium]